MNLTTSLLHRTSSQAAIHGEVGEDRGDTRASAILDSALLIADSRSSNTLADSIGFFSPIKRQKAMRGHVSPSVKMDPVGVEERKAVGRCEGERRDMGASDEHPRTN